MGNPLDVVRDSLRDSAARYPGLRVAIFIYLAEQVPDGERERILWSDPDASPPVLHVEDRVIHDHALRFVYYGHRDRASVISFREIAGVLSGMKFVAERIPFGLPKSPQGGSPEFIALLIHALAATDELIPLTGRGLATGADGLRHQPGVVLPKLVSSYASAKIVPVRRWSEKNHDAASFAKLNKESGLLDLPDDATPEDVEKVLDRLVELEATRRLKVNGSESLAPLVLSIVPHDLLLATSFLVDRIDNTRPKTPAIDVGTGSPTDWEGFTPSIGAEWSDITVTFLDPERIKISTTWSRPRTFRPNDLGLADKRKKNGRPVLAWELLEDFSTATHAAPTGQVWINDSGKRAQVQKHMEKLAHTFSQLFPGIPGRSIRALRRNESGAWGWATKFRFAEEPVSKFRSARK